MNLNTPLKYLLQILLCLLACQSNQLVAADIRYSAGLSLTHYENVNLVPVPISDTISSSVYTGVTAIEDNANFSINLNALYRATNYDTDTVNDESYAELITNNIWRIKPGEFEWYLSDTLTQTSIDTLSSNTVLNRQYINIFSTGPNYIVRLNPTNNLQFEARVENYNYEESLDSNRILGAARWFYTVNSALAININDEVQTTRYKDNINTDFDRNDVFLGLAYNRGVNAFNIEYGYTHINNENADDVDGNRSLVSFTNARTNTSSVRFIYESVLSDATTEITDNTLNGSINTSVDGASTTDVFVDDLYRIQFLKNLSNGSMIFEVSSNDRKYTRQINLDAKSKVAIINGVWNLKRTNNITYNLSYINRVYQDPSYVREDNDHLYTLTYSHGLTRNINLALETTSEERISTIANESYDDLRLIFSINYITL